MCNTLKNKPVKFQIKIPNGCWENSEKLYGATLFCRTLYCFHLCLSVCLSVSVRTQSSLQQCVSLPQRTSHLPHATHLPLLKLHKSCKKFTWRIYALSERLLVKNSSLSIMLTPVDRKQQNRKKVILPSHRRNVNVMLSIGYNITFLKWFLLFLISRR